MPTIYKIVPETLWREAVRAGSFNGAGIDLKDGYIHFSGEGTVRETAALHFKGQAGLVLVAFDDTSLGSQLKYEAARGGTLFPHFYGAIDPAIALWVKPLPLDAEGRHVFPVLSTATGN